MKSIQPQKKLSTRETILHTIKSAHEATVDELAKAADVSPVTVRHHLNALQADGTIIARAVRRKVGRPHYVYSLSEAGEELFPKKYYRLSSRLVKELKRRFDGEVVANIFDSVAKEIIDEHRPEFEGLPFEERLDYLIDLLAEEGFLAKWRKDEDGYKLTEYSCPYLSMGESHDEVCTFDKEIILTVLNTDVKQQSCMLEGDNCCEFHIPAPGKAVVTE